MIESMKSSTELGYLLLNMLTVLRGNLCGYCDLGIASTSRIFLIDTGAVQYSLFVLHFGQRFNISKCDAQRRLY